MKDGEIYTPKYAKIDPEKFNVGTLSLSFGPTRAQAEACFAWLKISGKKVQPGCDRFAKEWRHNNSVDFVFASFLSWPRF